jgi:hypothetical protein
MYLADLRKFEAPSIRRARTRGVLTACLLALVLVAAVRDVAAQTYTVKINPKLNGLDIKIEPVENTGVLVVNLTNGSDKKVRCDLNFSAQPQLPYRTTVFMDPGKSAAGVLRARQQWFEVDVDVTCKAAKSD